MNECMKTIVLKLYRPTSWKKSVIDEAMLNYSRAYQFLLDKAYENLNTIIKNNVDFRGKYKGSYISKWIKGDIDKELNKFQIEPFKDSIKMDFSAGLAGYLNLRAKGNKVNYPLAHIEKHHFEGEYNRLLSKYSEGNASLNTEHKIKKLVNKYNMLRPLFFCRYSTNRNYSILYDSDNDKYFAKIYLMNSKNNYRKASSAVENRKLVYIDKTEKIYKEGKNKRCFLIFPLSFGKWQEKYLKEALKNPQILKTARLYKRKGEYFLSISIVKEKPEPMAAENYMGISRGINSINYCLVNEKGSELYCSHIKIEDKNIAIDKLHDISNRLIKIARENKCKIVMEKLIDKGDNLSWRDKNGKVNIPTLDCASYNQLYSILDYKSMEIGIPKITRVSSLNIFYTCPCCGKSSKANRFSNDRIICVSCGTSMDINKVGSLNLSRKLIKYSKDTIKIIVEDTEKGLKFSNKELDLEYYPSNPFDCVDEFMKIIDKIVERFYAHMSEERKMPGFKKKLSLIKKIEANRNIFELIKE